MKSYATKTSFGAEMRAGPAEGRGHRAGARCGRGRASRGRGRRTAYRSRRSGRAVEGLQGGNMRGLGGRPEFPAEWLDASSGLVSDSALGTRRGEGKPLLPVLNEP
jgi:hypothetical protein